MTSPQPTSAPAARYELRDALGTGAMGEVVRAYDRVRGHEVALKYLLRADDPHWLLLFKQEYRLLADLVHPNVVSLYELKAVEEGRWVIAMELIEGARTFLDFVRPFKHLKTLDMNPSTAFGTNGSAFLAEHDATRTTSMGGGNRDDNTPTREPTNSALIEAKLLPQRLTEAVTQMVRGLDAVHRRGLLHRDVKPSNVLVDGVGRVVVCDFGLVTTSDTSEKSFLGTPAYAAPEQLLGTPSAESDFYGLGVMIYQAFTGRLPIWPTKQSEWLVAKQTHPIAPIDSDHPLADLALRLLHPDPEHRPSVAAIKDTLKSYQRRSVGISSAPDPETDTPFVGREAELTTLGTALGDARTMGPVQVDIRAASGTGKSALVAAFVKKAQAEAGAVVLKGRCYESESVPFKALDSLIDSLYLHLQKRERQARVPAAPPGLSALAQLFPVLRQLTFVLEATQTETIPKHLVVSSARTALLELLITVARDKPLIVVVDDLQWGDADSAPFFRAWTDVPHTGDPGFLVVTTRRSDVHTHESAHDVQQLGARHRTIDLAPLTSDEAVELARSVVPLAASELDALVQQSGGYPMFVLELARAASKLGLENISGANAPDLDALIVLRAQQLPDNARRLLEGASLVAEPQPLSLLARAMRVRNEAGALAELRAARMIRILPHRDGERVATYHDRVRESVIAKLEPKRKKQLHQRIARALQRAPRPDSESLMAHWAAAGDLVRATSYALSAARSAAAVGAFHRAAELYEKTLSWETLEGDERYPVMREWANTRVSAGQPSGAAKIYLELASVSPEAEADELRGQALTAFMRASDLTAALNLIESKAVAKSRVPSSKLTATLGIIRDRAFVSRHLPWKKPFTIHLEVDDEVRNAVTKLSNLSAAVGYIDSLRGYAMHSKLLREVIHVGDPQLLAAAASVEAIYIGSMKGAAGKKEVDAWLKEARRATRSMPSEGPLHSVRRTAYEGFIDGAEGMVLFCSGDRMIDAGNLMETGGRQQVRVPEHAVNGLQLQAYGLNSCVLGGSLRSADERYKALLRTAEEEGNEEARNLVLRQVAPLLLCAQDRSARAHQIVEENPPDASIFTLTVWWYEFGRAFIEEYDGNLAGAAKLYDELVERYRASSLVSIKAPLCNSLEGLSRTSAAMAIRGGVDGSAHRKRAHWSLRQLKKLKSALPLLARGGASQCLAILAAGDGHREAAIKHLRATVESWSQAQYFLSAMPAQLQLGRLIGGDEGATLIEEVEAWAQREGIGSLEQLTAARSPVLDEQAR
ncbi:MAG: serine/threonine-protein kinase PknK [Polyangiales bacterium]